jgi:hypothetical protein
LANLPSSWASLLSDAADCGSRKCSVNAGGFSEQWSP